MTLSEMDPQMSCTPTGKIVLRHIGEDRLLVPVSGEAARKNCIYPCNETAVFIWEQFMLGSSIQIAAESLSATYQVELSVALEDCRQYANDLIAEGLLEVRSL